MRSHAQAGGTKVSHVASGRFITRDSATGAIVEVSGSDLLDERSRRLLHISGAEFVRRYHAGDLPETPTVMHLAMLVGPRKG